MSYHGPERRQEIQLSDDQVERIANRVVEKLYARAGKGLLGKMTIGAALAVIGVLAWLAGAGHLKP